MTKFVQDTLLPSLFEKFQNRDKKYGDIIVSEKQADILYRNMEIRQSGGGGIGYYSPLVCWAECQWNGRPVYLRKRGRYYFISFGQTKDEEGESAMNLQKKRMQDEIDSAKKVVAKGKPERIEKRLADAKRRYEAWLEDIDDEDMDKEDRENSIRWINHYKKIIDILTS